METTPLNCFRQKCFFKIQLSRKKMSSSHNFGSKDDRIFSCLLDTHFFHFISNLTTCNLDIASKGQELPVIEICYLDSHPAGAQVKDLTCCSGKNVLAYL